MAMFRKRNVRGNTSTRNIRPSRSRETRRSTRNESVDLGPDHGQSLAQGRGLVQMKESVLPRLIRDVLLHQIRVLSRQRRLNMMTSFW